MTQASVTARTVKQEETVSTAEKSAALPVSSPPTSTVSNTNGCNNQDTGLADGKCLTTNKHFLIRLLVMTDTLSLILGT